MTLAGLARTPARLLRLTIRAAHVTARDPGRAWLMARMSLSYLAVTLFATFLPLKRSFALISPGRPSPHSPPRTAAHIASALDSILQAGVPFVRPRCWRRAAVLHRYLALEGIRTQIVFGVIAADMQLKEAHAWVERDGQPLAEAAPVERYRKIHTFG